MIKFPKMHVAASVVNRIMNAHHQLNAQAAAPASRPPSSPNVPDNTQAGVALDAELGAPQMPVTADEPLATDIATKGLL